MRLHGDLPQHIIDMMSDEDRADIGLKSTGEIAAETDAKRHKADCKAEKVIQSEVEGLLINLGYERRTPESIKRCVPRSGWFIHIFAAKKNPIICDLLIWNNERTKVLELELKTQDGRLTDEQAALVGYGHASLARSSKQAYEIIKEWEKL